MTDTDRVGINESINQNSYVQNRVQDSPDKNAREATHPEREDKEPVDYGDEEEDGDIGEEI